MVLKGVSSGAVSRSHSASSTSSPACTRPTTCATGVVAPSSQVHWKEHTQQLTARNKSVKHHTTYEVGSLANPPPPPLPRRRPLPPGVLRPGCAPAPALWPPLTRPATPTLLLLPRAPGAQSVPRSRHPGWRQRG
jgi:hypothetical protein